MITKKSPLVFFLFVIFQSIFSQEIAIPYRDGKLWGICNETGEILIEPKFDKLEFDGSSSSYSKHDLMTSHKNGMKGLLINGNEILQTKYNYIYASDGLITIASDENGSTQDVVMFDGASVFKRPIAHIISSGRIFGSYELFHVINRDLSESIFVFDTKSKKIVQSLYENYYSLLKKGRQTYPENYTFLVKKTDKDGLSSETWNFSKFPFKKTIYKNSVDDEKYYAEQFIRQANKKQRENYSESSYGISGDGGMAVEEVSVERIKGVGEGRFDDVVAIPDTDNSNSVKVKSTRISYNFSSKNDKIILQKTTSISNEKPLIEEISTNFDSKNANIKSFYTSKKENETTINFNSYLVIKNKKKSAIVFAENLDNLVYFDSITSIVREIKSENYSSKEIVFVVGNFDKKGIMKYGLYSNNRNLISELIYDEIKQTILPSHNQNSVFQTKIGSKFGFILADGTVFAAPKYDEIKEINSSKNNYEKMIQTKVDNQYGLLFSNNNSIVFVEAFSPYQIQDVIKNYPEQSNQILPEQRVTKKPISLISLKDASGKFIGYASIKGQQYFKN